MSVANRYSCQVKLPGFSPATQAKLKHAKVLVVGAGGLGCPAAQYLASAGIGTLAIADFDKVSHDNLHRQILFSPQSVGKLKVNAAAAALRRQNPEIVIEPLPVKIAAANVREVIKPFDIVVDCTDNFDTRLVLSDGCVLADKPLVYGAAYQYEGQVAVWNTPNGDGSRSPHYRDIFPVTSDEQAMDCSSGGVMPTLTGIIGCMEANETIKYLAGLPGVLASRLLIFDVRTMQSQILNLPRASWTPVRQLMHDVPEIPPSDLQAALSASQYTLIDVRSSAEHTDFNIGGQLLPLEDILSGQASLNLDMPIVFYCATGRRSVIAAKHVLANNPAATVFSLAGGIATWQQD